MNFKEAMPVYLIYLLIASLAYFTAVTLVSIYGRVHFDGVDSINASASFLRELRLVPTLISLTPFSCLAVMFGYGESRSHRACSRMTFAASCAVTAIYYAQGVWDVRQAIKNELWTAAALNEAMLPLGGMLIVLVSSLAFRICIGKR